jgi:hypothetical protein
MAKYNKKDTKYELYHPDHDIVVGTKEDFIKLEPRFKAIPSQFSRLIKNRIGRAYGWVLSENIDKGLVSKTKSNLTPRKFYCLEEGIIECTIEEFYEKYLKPLGGSYISVYSLCAGRTKTLYNKWVLAENKDKYEYLLVKSVAPRTGDSYVITLSHPEFGTHELSRNEFVNRFGLNKQWITELATGRAKTRRGWSLVK